MVRTKSTYRTEQRKYRCDGILNPRSASPHNARTHVRRSDFKFPTTFTAHAVAQSSSNRRRFPKRCRALDYLVANKQLVIRRIGTRVLIPVSELRKFSRADHPERLVD
jgi:hypothetical protein